MLFRLKNKLFIYYNLILII